MNCAVKGDFSMILGHVKADDENICCLRNRYETADDTCLGTKGQEEQGMNQKLYVSHNKLQWHYVYF